MNTRYVTSLLLAVAGAFLVVASQAFTAGTTAWLAFAIGIGALVLAGVPAAFRERSPLGLALDGVLAVLAAWTIVASLVFAGSTVVWLSFAEGLGIAALAVGGLTLDHVRMLRLVRGEHRTVPTPWVDEQRTPTAA